MPRSSGMPATLVAVRSGHGIGFGREVLPRAELGPLGLLEGLEAVGETGDALRAARPGRAVGGDVDPALDRVVAAHDAGGRADGDAVVGQVARHDAAGADDDVA